MDASHHMASVMELDLTAFHYPNSLVDRINAMPALKTSAAFFTFLRANLAILPTEMSNVSTPILEPTILVPASAERTSRAAGAGLAPAPTPAPGSGSGLAGKLSTGLAASSLDDIPPLSLGVLTSSADKVDALRLVADSIAQQRQIASRSLALHPLNVAGLATVLGVTYNYSSRQDLGTMLSILSGVTMSYLLLIRYYSSRYIAIAEGLDWRWLLPDHVQERVQDRVMSAKGGAKGGAKDAFQDVQDTIIGARYGDEMIGALVLRLEAAAEMEAALASATTSASASVSSATATAASVSAASASTSGASPRKKNHRSGNSGNALRGGHGVIRAWTTKLRYRRRGIGSDLLAEAVRVTRDRCGKDAIVGFAQEHANSRRVLPSLYNGPFRASERQATLALTKVLADLDGSKRRR